ncbi:expressed unknown protein [Seminavis robusta]|uniref:Uncharacterized protein n=1 Tax=Seminavis robusta TaxID=568900 RepID=A0A9N8EA23_9STRA|nr:expressed unknown protein [Seminavis robusta]|eukprot:Sro846_g210170.1 n/a (287) ;mRNA; f:27528-28388
MSNDPELYKKLVDDEEDVEEQMKKPLVTAKATPKSSFRMPCVCKCLLITTTVFFSLTLAAGVGGYFWMKDFVDHFTVTTPSPDFPVVDMTGEELQVVEDRVKLFVDQLVAGEHPAEDLTVTQDEINGFIGHSDYLRGNAMVTLHKDIIKEEYSFPTWMLPGGKDRYFVGHDYMKLNEETNSIEMEMETAAKHSDWFDGPLYFAQLQWLVTKNKQDEGKTMLQLFLTKGSFFGQEAPQDYIEKRENLLKSLYEEADCEDAKAARAVIAGIEHVVIEEGKIIVKPRKA